RALGEHTDGAEEARGHADLRAVGDDGLLGLAAAVGVEDIEREIVLLEVAGGVADLGDESLADAAAADGDLQAVLGEHPLGRERSERKHCDQPARHGSPPGRRRCDRRPRWVRIIPQRGDALPAPNGRTIPAWERHHGTYSGSTSRAMSSAIRVTTTSPAPVRR